MGAESRALALIRARRVSSAKKIWWWKKLAPQPVAQESKPLEKNRKPELT